MGEYALAVLPYNDFSPQACSALAVALEDAITALGRWNIRISSDGRLRIAQNHLIKVAESGSYGETEEELIQTAKAAFLAKDFYEISTALNHKRDDPIAEELVRALKGTLDGKTDKKTPYAIQSQYWAGMLFAQSGLKPAVPSNRTGRKIDFVVSLGTLNIAIEVKRPSSVKSALRCLESAADQLRGSKFPGVICLDLSEFVATDDLIIPSGPVSARQVMDYRMSIAQRVLVNHIDSYTRSDKFSRIIDLILFSRYWVWKILNPPENDVGFTFRIHPYPDACSRLIVGEITLFQKKLLRGMRKLSDAFSYSLRR